MVTCTRVLEYTIASALLQMRNNNNVGIGALALPGGQSLFEIIDVCLPEVSQNLISLEL